MTEFVTENSLQTHPQTPTTFHRQLPLSPWRALNRPLRSSERALLRTFMGMGEKNSNWWTHFLFACCGVFTDMGTSLSLWASSQQRRP